jgi:hypothetical protein
MGWSAIITAILSVVGPLLKEWLAKWLEGLLKDTAKKMKLEVGSGMAVFASRELLTAARRELWVWQVGKRRLLAKMAATVPPCVGGYTLPTEQRMELEDLAAACG